MSPRLPDSSEPSLTSRIDRALRKAIRRSVKAIMKSHKFRIPKYDLPIRLRPWFMLFTSLIMVLLAFLGFTRFVQRLPVNDSAEILHFLCLGVATGVFYFIWDVDEEARRIWIWRHTGLILTYIVCFFFGGIVSEIVQSILPYKEFQIGDVIANLSGSSVGLWVSYHLERYYRHRREISRLYRPLSAEEDELLSDSESESDAGGGIRRSLPLLPTHQTHKSSHNKSQGQIRLGNVWDEREELFEIGEEEEDERAAGRPSEDTPRPSHTGGPQITVTAPS